MQDLACLNVPHDASVAALAGQPFAFTVQGNGLRLTEGKLQRLEGRSRVRVPEVNGLVVISAGGDPFACVSICQSTDPSLRAFQIVDGLTVRNVPDADE